jgi:hypothetical protein
MKKKLIVFAIVAIVAAVVAGIAFAWWTSADPAVGGNTVATGEAGALTTSGLPLTVSGLVPIADPSAGDLQSDALTAADGASVSYFYVENSGKGPLMFYGSLSDGSITYVDPSGPNNTAYLSDLINNVQVRISLVSTAANNPVGWVLPDSWAASFNTAGGPYTVYNGTLATLWNGGTTAGLEYLSSRGHSGNPAPNGWIDTPIAVGQYAVYRVVTWLDGAAGNDTQNNAVSFTLHFTGMQPAAWTAAAYDSTGP